MSEQTLCFEGGDGMVTVSQVENTLLPWLGSHILSRLQDQCVFISRCLNSPRDRQNLQELSRRLSLLLYGQVKALTGGRMIVVPDGGYPVQTRTEDFSVMADDLLFLLFNDFPADAEHMLLIRSFSMEEASLAALRALYTRFSAFQTKEELQTIRHIASTCYPVHRVRGWLNTKST